MAYNLGMNLDCSPWVASGKMTAQEANVRSITWWACYKLDRCALPRKKKKKKTAYKSIL